MSKCIFFKKYPQFILLININKINLLKFNIKIKIWERERERGVCLKEKTKEMYGKTWTIKIS